MHEYHERLPGYDAGNILHDGCGECEDRAANPLTGLTALDHQNFRQAWSDMLALRWCGGAGLDRNLSACDRRLVDALYTVAVLLERSTNLSPHTLYGLIEARSDEAEALIDAMFGGRS